MEGPSALHVGEEIILYFDAYTRHRYEALASTDFKTWRDVTKELAMPGASATAPPSRFPADRAEVARTTKIRDIFFF